MSVGGSSVGGSSIGGSHRDGEIEAFVVDRYLESLLARQPIDPDGVPPELEQTARRLAGALPRYHPSFRFEEALARRLAAVGGEPTGGGEVLAFPRRPGRALTPLTNALAPAIDRRFGRPTVVGGVLTSAALSLAGAAFVAWRLGRSPDALGARAARVVARARAS